MTSFHEAYLVKQRIADKILKIQGVHGIGVGLKDSAKPHRGAALILYTTSATASSFMKRAGKNAPLSYINSAARTISGVPVRIVSVERFSRLSKSKDQFMKRKRPVIAGYSIGTPAGSGTAGLIVSMGRCERSRYILSNNHVLVNNNSSRASPTIQPGGADGGNVDKNLIGYAERFVKLKKHKVNYIDAAISKPLRSKLVKPQYAVFGKVHGYIAAYKVGDRFKKVGRTTGVVTGTVESIHTDIQVYYNDYGKLGVITFKDQSIIRSDTAVSLPGDSGSVWLTSRGNKAAAVNFAGSDDGKLSISYPIHWFMQVFGARVAGSRKQSLKRPERNENKQYVYTQPLPSNIIKQLPVRKCRPLKKQIDRQAYR